MAAITVLNFVFLVAQVWKSWLEFNLIWGGFYQLNVAFCEQIKYKCYILNAMELKMFYYTSCSLGSLLQEQRVSHKLHIRMEHAPAGSPLYIASLHLLFFLFSHYFTPNVLLISYNMMLISYNMMINLWFWQW